MPVILWRASIIAVMLVASCSRPQHENVDSHQDFHQQLLVVTDYGDDGILAYFPPNESKLYKVIFNESCASCLKAARTIKPLSVYETKLCNFQITASGTVRPSLQKMSGVLDVSNVTTQPTLKSCARIE